MRLKSFSFFPSLLTRAPQLTAALESLIIAGFFSTLLLSFYGWMGKPWLFALAMLALAACTYRVMAPARHTCKIADAPWPVFERRLIIGLLLFFVFLSFFITPGSSDGNRIKLTRMLLGVYTGSAWDSSRIDPLSIMYTAPAPYYFIMSFVEALQLPRIGYAIFNTALIFGSALNIFLLLPPTQRSLRMASWVFLFFLAPQFLFSGLSEHEDALTLFLATRAAVWLIAMPPSPRSLFFFLLACALSVGIKYSTLVFLPFALLALWLSFAPAGQLRTWLTARHLLLAPAVALVIGFVVLIPDALVSAGRGLTIADQMTHVSSYHVGKAGCMPAHFLLRLFELGFDAFRVWINFLKLDITHTLPDYHFMPQGCAMEDTSLKSYFTPTSLTRDYTQYGYLPWVALAGLAAPGRARKFAAFSLGAFLLSVAIYTKAFTFWIGTGRYFIVGVLALFPAYWAAMTFFAQKPSARVQKIVLVLLAAPAVLIFARMSDAVPRMISKGDRYTSYLEDIAPALKQINGKTNIYFNDLMLYYTLLKLIPSQDITLLKQFVPDATNIIAVPRIYSSDTNWHDDYWLIPLPDSHGDFYYMGPVKKAFGNRVPVAFYMGIPGKPATVENTVRLVHFSREDTLEHWLKSLSTRYHISAIEKGVFYIHEKMQPQDSGLCLMQQAEALRWKMSPRAECKGE